MAVAVPRADRRLNPRTDPLSPWFHIDLVLVLATASLALFGLALIYSATRGTDPAAYDTFYAERQATFLILGGGIMAGTTVIPYHHLRPLATWIMLGGIFGVLVTLSPLGVRVNGAQNWIAFGSLQLQPSEFVKVGLILMLAAFLSRFDGHLGFRPLLTAMIITGVPLGLVLLQPDLGTGLVFVAIMMAMCLVGGIRLRHAVAFTIIGAFFVVAVIESPLLDQYQRDRLTSFLAPDGDTDAAFQQQQAQLAIGHGGMTGTGFGEGSQTRGQWVPEAQTDFIFTVVGEEFGLIGSATLLGLLGIIIWRTWRTAAMASDLFGTLICVGVIAMLTFQMFQAIGMTMGIMPITGIPVPLVSYGGSSALTTLASVGLVLNVHMRRHQPAPRRLR